jgi:hypothetical protein
MKRLSVFFVLSLAFWFSVLLFKTETVRADLYCGDGQSCPDGVTRFYRDWYDCHWSGGSCVDGYTDGNPGTCSARSSGCPGSAYCCGFYYGNQVITCDRNLCTYTLGTRWFDCCPGGPPPPPPPPPCNPTTTAGDCGWLNTCETDQRFYSTTYDPSGCEPDYTECNDDASCRPPVCVSSSRSGSRVTPSDSITVTITGDPTSGGSNPNPPTISQFYLAFYNMDNLYPAGDPIEIFFGGVHYVRTDCVRSGDSCTFTVTFAELDRVDENWGANPENISVSGYFLLSDGGFSAPDPNCVQRTITVDPTMCDITAYNITFNGIGDVRLTTPIAVNTTEGGNIANVLFTVNPPLVAEVTGTYPNPDTTAAYQVEMRSLIIGNSTYTALATMDDANSTTCFSTADIEVDVPPAWCQFKNGSVLTNGSVSCQVPVGSYLMTYDIPGTPGVPIAGGSVTYAPGGLSTTNWRAENTPYAGSLPSYSAFRNKIPLSTSLYSLGSSVNEATLLTWGTQYPSGSGYYYFNYDGSAGDLVLQDGDGVIDLGTRKVVIFTDSAVNINSKILLTKGQGFFMIISSGDISISSSVGGPQEATPLPDLEGVYYTDGGFITGTLDPPGSDQQLHVRGVVVAKDSVVMQRIPPFADIPGELFEFAPDQSMLIPSILSQKLINWREVLP